MQIPKEQILELLRSRGDQDKANQAEGELPEQVDTDQDAGLLEKLGINPSDLLGQFEGGDLGKKLGL
jgi:predicted Zn-dependent protease with MMP-like domain